MWWRRVAKKKVAGGLLVFKSKLKGTLLNITKRLARSLVTCVPPTSNRGITQPLKGMPNTVSSLLFSSFCPCLFLRMIPPLFFKFLHFLFHHKMISLINLFNKHARGAFRLTGSALGSKGKAVDMVLYAWEYRLWNLEDGCWDGEPQGDRRTPTEHLTQTWAFHIFSFLSYL